MSDRYDDRDRWYAIIDLSQLTRNQFLLLVEIAIQDSWRTCRYSLNGRYSILKYEGIRPARFAQFAHAIVATFRRRALLNELIERYSNQLIYESPVTISVGFTDQTVEIER
jgi:hypothetical protein